MKFNLSSALLVSVTLFPALGMAAASDATLAEAVSASPLVGGYMTLVLLALMVSDYTRRSRTLGLHVGSRVNQPVLLPAPGAFSEPLASSLRRSTAGRGA
ncbi:MAG: hypothetical protein JNN01_19650 [Opitutaceae bacterium]|nr:hypothetical protein [Opitutaceae bacterium]